MTKAGTAGPFCYGLILCGCSFLLLFSLFSCSFFLLVPSSTRERLFHAKLREQLFMPLLKQCMTLITAPCISSMPGRVPDWVNDVLEGKSRATKGP